MNEHLLVDAIIRQTLIDYQNALLRDNKKQIDLIRKEVNGEFFKKYIPLMEERRTIKKAMDILDYRVSKSKNKKY